ncbi:MAG: Aldehyde ferredoxin oxidoreductase, partial [Deltaproteobacteria bacterium]|nr:Aldehyde ferredoxin oxidoreductase [Deltaproteobacteria bacterium]
MKILRVDIKNEKMTLENLGEEWKFIGGSAFIAKMMNKEVPPAADPLGPENLFMVAIGPLAGTGAPQLGRISVGGKSPLTLGIKEANSGGPAAQILDRLGIRAVIVQGGPHAHRLYCIFISKDKTKFIPVNKLRKRYGEKIAVISTGIAGERKYKGASVSFTDIFGDPSRNAARGGLGAVMGSKGLKAIIIDPSQAGQVDIAHPEEFRRVVKSWVDTLKHDISCSLYSCFGTPFAISNSASQGTLPSNNYRSGRPANFIAVSGDSIQKILFERGGKMHGCMPGCVVQCSIIYPDKDGKRLCSAYEYETIAMLGTNLGITDPDAIARLKFMCDDLGVDAIETGSSLGLYLSVTRIPAYKGQAIPAHDPRSVKGTGVTYFTSPMGADHTAGLTYKMPRNRDKQAENSLRSQIQAATCDAFGYCLNSVPGGRASIYQCFADLMNATYGLRLTPNDIMEIGKQTLRDQLTFNEKAEFSKMDSRAAAFVREEKITPTGQVFDVDDAEIENVWKGLDSFQEKEKVWEVRIPPLPDMMFGAGVVENMGERVRR